jgi:hypothetical protein
MVAPKIGPDEIQGTKVWGWAPDDGSHAGPSGEADGPDEVVARAEQPPPTKGWQRDLATQIAWTVDAIARLEHAIMVWEARASACYVPGAPSEAHVTLARIWDRLRLRQNGLRYLRSYVWPQGTEEDSRVSEGAGGGGTAAEGGSSGGGGAVSIF